MKKHALFGAALAALVSTPALALEHEVVIDHNGGAIAADYRGAVTVQTKQTGTAGVAGRASTLACRWTASLTVDRVAKVGETLQSRRTLTSEDVASGSRPGWCHTQAKAIDQLVDARRETFRTAMQGLVEQDRVALLAEADSNAAAPRG